MKISIGQSKKRYTHRLNRDVNTTFPFGIVQPIFKQLLTPQDTVNVSSRQLVRLAPMVVPSFARLGLYTTTRFVPLVDVVPYSDALYAKQPYNTGVGSSFVPKFLPFTSNAVLTLYLLSLSNYSLYRYDSATSQYVPDTATTDDNVKKEVTSLMLGLFTENVKMNPNLHFDNYVSSKGQSAYIYSPTPESADYIVFSHSSTDVASHPNLCVCFQFGSYAKTLRNILLGLGYSCEFDDYDKVSLVPLLSFYKAWFDTYGLTRFKNFTDSVCFRLIKFIELYNYDFTSNTNTLHGDVTTMSLLFDFLYSLCECFYSSPTDFVTLHRASLQTVSNTNFTYTSSDGTARTIGQNSDKLGDGKPDDVHLDVDNKDSRVYNPSISSVSLRVLQSLSRFVNKNSILGQNIAKWMGVKFGASVVNSVFEQSNRIDSSYMPFNINDVFSTSDTALGTGADATGEHLGAYAGKGIGTGSISFRFTAPCHGFVITLACVASDSAYFQGNDPSLFALDYETSPNSDFDALGMEVTRRSCIINHNSISNRTALNYDDLSDASFGFVPRYTGFKVSKNIVNGDMSRRGSIDSMSPYYLDRILTSSQVLVTESTPSGRFALDVHSSRLPSADYDWRFMARYPQLGNFNRLFINDVGPLDKGSYLPSGKDSYRFFCLDDPYLCQCIFNVSLSNTLKPISMSFDTFDTTDDKSVDVPVA